MTLPLDALSSPAATHQGALERFTRDGGMVSFDDRVSLPKPPERALSTVFDMRDHLGQLIATNLAARLCEEAKPGQILVSRRVFAAVEHVVEAEPIGVFTFKGFLGPVPVFDARSRKGDP